jgi:hypothetical protein
MRSIQTQAGRPESGKRSHPVHRELLIQKLFFNEYMPINSFYPGTSYENPSNPKPYNPEEVLKL